jgi:membrane protein
VQRLDRRRLSALFRAVVTRVREEQVTFLAAAIAYYAFASLVPLLLLTLAAATVLGGEALATELVERMGDVLSPVARDTIEATFTSASGATSATVVGVPLLAWSTLKVFRGLDIAFSEIYGTEQTQGFIAKVTDAALVLGAVGLGVLAVVLAGLFANYSGIELAGILGTVALVVVLAVTFFPLFYLLPDREMTVWTAAPGVTFAAVGWTVLGTVFRMYAGVAGSFELYGVLGGALLLVTWFYVGSLVVLVGATLNAVVAQTGNYNNQRSDTSPTERA